MCFWATRNAQETRIVYARPHLGAKEVAGPKATGYVEGRAWEEQVLRERNRSFDKRHSQAVSALQAVEFPSSLPTLIATPHAQRQPLLINLLRGGPRRVSLLLPTACALFPLLGHTWWGTLGFAAFLSTEDPGGYLERSHIS
ncbi:hypothetical protein NDU88_002483 [Pleurodeles waltl]|uniref:Uncharacterized protein n=1 Tax=Pleurodeles waltl TaxID=8319 RepID=A0AAV7UYS0_PLEWA|nr:hypothetical protein NDU88_002483 [Pleurodeles waltl]